MYPLGCLMCIVQKGGESLSIPKLKCYFFFKSVFRLLVGESIEVMHAGTMVLKLRGLSKKYPRRYFLDQQAANIRWTPSKKGDRAKSKYALTCHLREVEEIIMILT